MLCLGFECTAHTFGAAIVDSSGRFLSSEKASFISTGKGMVPREVLTFHKAHASAVLDRTLAAAGPDVVEKIDAIAISQGPGIGTLLHEGLQTACTLADTLDVPLFGINHAVAHLEIGRKECSAKDPVYLYVSGGNTQLLIREDGDGQGEKNRASRYHIVGETLDIGIGNLLDKSARLLGLGFPGGPPLYELSLKGKNFVELPYTIKGMDVCFSGLYTAFKNRFEHVDPKKDAVVPADLAFSLQEVAFDMVCEAAERALSHFEKDELVLAGGVACSKVLQEKTKIMCQERGAKMLVPENKFLTDNGAMIAWNGILALQGGQKPLGPDAKAKPDWRADDVAVVWP
ncbi:tRNA (adenosine(37)-N6)-threonylcarbamoyltransferase complex transferase subunit TsaD [Candidatus Micrarchaeota archaeon]|nr:tRNA (adenosine(37)-N6)-threonylcarbamoyltransferase complex transferase subunit TsaD [Candidatus Micrarchaeota archaeon]